MPISIKTFKEAKIATTDRVLRFLREHPDQAYKLDEIIAPLEQVTEERIAFVLMIQKAMGTGDIWDRYKAAVEELVSQGRVEQVDLAGETYFAARGEQ